MIKLCNCKKKLIREEVESIVCYDGCTSSIIRIVESDCLCEKKELQSETEKAFDAGYQEANKERVPTEAVIFSLGGKTARVVKKILESKSHSPCTCDSAFHINGSKVHRPDCLANVKRQKIESPCEHKWEREFFLAETITNTGHYLRPIWCCYKEGCGLVTCIDPNDK